MATAAFLAAACLFAYWIFGGHSLNTPSTEGLVNGWSGPWLSYGIEGPIAGYAANLLIAILITYLNRIYNVMRCPSKLGGALLLCMQLAVPSSMCQINPGWLLALVMLLCYFCFFSAFARNNSQRNVFLAFFLLSLLSASTWLALVFMLVLWLGMMQMRIFSLRSFLASLMGIATPWIILLGLGIVPVDSLQVPTIIYNSDFLKTPYVSMALVLATLTAFLGISAWAQGVMKILSYNAQSRAMISMITVTMLITIVLMVADYRSVLALLPLLNCCVAMQTVHLFGVIYNKGKSYWAIISIICVYLAFYTWTLLRCIL